MQAAVDIMEKQGGSIADRPRMVAAGEILSYGESLTFAHVGDRFRRMRRYAVCGTIQITTIFYSDRDAEHSMLISSLKQLRSINPCRCCMRRTWSSTFLMIPLTFTTIL
jgi:hypothetical protein